MLTARDATAEDYTAACEMWVAFGSEQPAPSEADWNARFRQHTMWLDTEAGEHAGYALWVPLGARGDIRHIMVAPAWRGRGVARPLMEAVRARLRAVGCSEWRLEVRDDNALAIALYRKVGMAVIQVLVSVRLTHAQAEAFATVDGTHVREVDPADDAALERAWDLGAGQLARCRTVPDSFVWRIGDDALVHYRAQLAPGISLMFPFRAKLARHAACLVSAALGRGMQAALEVLVVGDEAAAPFLAAGGRVTERSLEMGGPLAQLN